MESTTITVTVYRRSFLPRMVKAEKILLDQMSTGWIKDGRFVPGETGEEAVLAYHKEHIGRGIQIHWKKDDPRFTELKIELPASEEEIDDFFLMAARLAKQDICEVYLNATPFLPKQYHQKKDAWKTANLRLLHTMMGEVLNQETDVLKLNCVFRTFYADMDDAETMWAGVDTSALRNWFHANQNPDWYYSCYSIDTMKDALRIPLGMTAVLPQISLLKNLQKTVVLFDPAADKDVLRLGGALLEELSYERLDEGMIRVDALDESCLQRLKEKAVSFNGQ